jgi:hypothetical protein
VYAQFSTHPCAKLYIKATSQLLVEHLLSAFRAPGDPDSLTILCHRKMHLQHHALSTDPSSQPLVRPPQHGRV